MTETATEAQPKSEKSRQVIFTGTADFQEFGAADFAKAGIEQRKIVFAQGEPVDVTPEVAEALCSDDPDNIFGLHMFEDVTEEDAEQVAEASSVGVDDSQQAANEKSDAKGAPTSGKKAKAQSGATDSAASTNSTGAGSSTASSTT